MTKTVYSFIVLLFIPALFIFANPHSKARQPQNSIIGKWQVVMRGVSNFSTNQSHLNSLKMCIFRSKPLL